MSKKKLLGILLGIEAVLCVLFALLWRGQSDVTVFKIIHVPFEWVGKGLRYLSLASATGNVMAFILYFALCLIPVAVAIYFKIKKKAKWEEWLLLLLSALMFWGVYIFINPMKIADFEGGIVTVSGYKIEIVSTILSIIIFYVVMKVVRAVCAMKEKGLIKSLKYICAVALMTIVIEICFIGVSELLLDIQTAVEHNAYIENTVAVLIVKFIVEKLPSGCLFIIVCSLLKISGTIRKGLINQKVLDGANKISNMCKVAIVVIMFSIMVVNIMQMAMASFISIADYNITIPVFDVLVIIVLLIVTKMIAEGHKIKEDNDLFI